MSLIQNIEVSVSEGLICETLCRHAFETFDVPRFSGVQHKGYNIPWVWLNCPLALSGVF